MAETRVVDTTFHLLRSPKFADGLGGPGPANRFLGGPSNSLFSSSSLVAGCGSSGSRAALYGLFTPVAAEEEELAAALGGERADGAGVVDDDVADGGGTVESDCAMEYGCTGGGCNKQNGR